MSYFDVALIPVPKDKQAAYLDHAREAAPAFRKHGALRVIETWGDDVPEGEITSYPMAVKCTDDETVIVSIVEWPDKATRDAALPKVMAAMENDMTTPMPFDGKRLIYGGFDAILDQ